MGLFYSWGGGKQALTQLGFQMTWLVILSSRLLRAVLVCVGNRFSIYQHTHQERGRWYKAFRFIQTTEPRGIPQLL